MIKTHTLELSLVQSIPASKRPRQRPLRAENRRKSASPHPPTFFYYFLDQRMEISHKE